MRRLVAVITAGFALVALGFTIAAAPPASAAPRCVGLVVDFGGGSVQSTCVPYHDGMTGTQVLSAAGHKTTDKKGFLCQIDGHPAKCASDNKHYWSYYHRAAGATKWAYSTKGSDQYRVHPGETEGWAWVNGKTRQPKSVPYAQLAAAAKPSPAATRSASQQPTSSATKSAAAGKNSGGGTPWGLIIGIIAVVVIVGAAAGRQVLRRRHA